MATITPFCLNLNKEKIVSWLLDTQAVPLSLFPRKSPKHFTPLTLSGSTYWPAKLMLHFPKMSIKGVGSNRVSKALPGNHL